jgi:hypothetical protein
MDYDTMMQRIIHSQTFHHYRGRIFASVLHTVSDNVYEEIEEAIKSGEMSINKAYEQTQERWE